MLRDNLAGLIEPMLSSAAAHTLGGHPKRDKLGDAPGQPSWRSSLVSDPSAKFSVGNRATGEKNEWPGFKVTTQAHDSRAVRTAQHKSHRTIDPQCLENPRFPLSQELGVVPFLGFSLLVHFCQAFWAVLGNLKISCPKVRCRLSCWS